MTDMPLKILIVYGSVRSDRVGIRLATYLQKAISAEGHSSFLLDPLKMNFPLLDRMYKEYPLKKAPVLWQEVAAEIKSSDAVIVVSAEYNHAPPPALLNVLDHFLEEWFFKPAGIVTYSTGRFGGVRAVSQLRMTLAELGMPSISTLLPVPHVADAVDEHGQNAADWLVTTTDQFLSELAWWARAARRELKESRSPFGGGT